MTTDIQKGDASTDECSTASTVEKQSNLTPWPKGVSGNPKGRPKGSRNRVNEKFWIKSEAIIDAISNEDAIRAAKFNPAATMSFLKMLAGLQTSKVETDLNITHQLSEELEAARSFADAWAVMQKARQVLGARPMVIDQELVEVEPVEVEDRD